MMNNKTNLVIGEDWAPINPIVLLLFLFASTCFCLLSKKKGKMPFFGKTFVVYYVYFIIISVFHAIYHPISGMGITVIIELFFPILIFYVSFFAQQDKALNNATKQMILVLYICFTYGLIRGFFSQTAYLEEDFVEQNNSYVFLMFLPFVLLVKNNDRNRWYYLIASIIAVVISMKRGGILGLLLGLVIYFVLKKRLDGNVKGTPVFRGLFYLIALVAIVFFIDSLTGGMIMERFVGLSEDGGSGRDLIWLEVISYIASSSTFEKLIGHGFDTVKNVTTFEIGAHNDFLEMIYDIGWIGIGLFLIFVISLIVFIVRNKKQYMVPSLGMAITAYLMVALAVHIITQTEYTCLLALCYGAACGSFVMEEKEIMISK